MGARYFAAGFAIGLIAGGITGYLATRHYLEHKYQEQANAEIDEMRASFDSKIGKIKEIAKTPVNPIKQEHREYVAVPFTKDQAMKKDYTKFIKSSKTTDPVVYEHPMDDGEEGEAVEIDEGRRYLESQSAADRQSEAENSERDRRRPPRLIRAEEYGTDSRFEPASLYYYVLDDTLATEAEEKIDRDDIPMHVGDALTKYGFIDDDNATAIYVRNERLACDYEITKVNAAYVDCVARD